MKKTAYFVGMYLVSSLAMAHGKVVYLSCPQVDERAPDLKVTLDQENGTASLQTDKGGAGLNFTSSASFGPEQVSWRKDTRGFKQTFSVNRSTLVLERKTLSGMTGDTYSEKSNCSIIQASKKNKF